MRALGWLGAIATTSALAIAFGACSDAVGGATGAAPDAAPEDGATADAPSDAASGSDARPGVDLSGYYEAYAVIGCQKTFDCCNAFGDDPLVAQSWRGPVASRDGCTQAAVPSALADDENATEGYVSSGTVVYHPEAQQACLDALAQLSCDQFFNDPELHTPAPCVALFEGKLPPGGACSGSVQCPAGDGCIGPPNGLLTCQSVPQQGQPCAGYCPAHLYCDTTSSTCVPQLAEGSPCDPQSAQPECQGVCQTPDDKCGPPSPKLCEGTAGCAPGDTECVGNAVATCTPQGNWGTPAPCANQACVGDTCSGVCAPSGTAVCNGNQPQTCDANGHWQNAGPACAQPTPDCKAGTCTCLDTTCSGQCVDVQTDPNNCGACGVACSGTCSAGRCVLILASGQTDVQDLVTDGINLYWTDLANLNSGTVSSVPVGGGTATLLSSGLYGPSAISVAGSSLFFVDNPGIKSVATTGGSTTTLASDSNIVQTLAVGGGDVYFADYYVQSIDVVPTGASDGGAGTKIASGVSATALAVDATSVYFGSGSSPTGLMKAPIGGGSAVMMAAGATPKKIVLDGTNIYWTTNSGGAVMQMPIAGGTPITLASGQPNPVGIAVDGTSVYWTNWYGGGSVMKVPIGGGTPVTLVTGEVSSTASVVVDATSVYFATNATIMKITPK